MKELLIIGASGHGKVVADIAVQLNKYRRISFLDDNEKIATVMGFQRIGAISMLETESREKEVIVAIGNAVVRGKLEKWILGLGFRLAILIHPKAVLAEDVVLGEGTVVMPGAIINSGSCIGNGVIVNTACSIDHDCIIKDYAHISVGAHLAGTVCVGERTWIGAGATVSNNVTICDDVMIGAGAVVVKNIEEAGTYVGVPAKRLK